MNFLFMKYFQKFNFVIMSGLIATLLTGCAVTPNLPVLSRDQVPKGGRYTIVVRESGNLTFKEVATTVFSNETQYVKYPSQVLSRMKNTTIDILTKHHNFEYVPNDLKLNFVPPPYYINSYDKSFSYGNNAKTQSQEKTLTANMKKLSEELKLDFIIIINEWGSSDYIFNTNQPLEGFGVYFRTFMGMKKISSYIAYQINIYDPKSTKYAQWSGLKNKKLDKKRWIDIESDTLLSIKSILPFIDDIESISPPNDWETTLCIVGLLPIQQGSSGFTNIGKCEDSYGENQ